MQAFGSDHDVDDSDGVWTSASGVTGAGMPPAPYVLVRTFRVVLKPQIRGIAAAYRRPQNAVNCLSKHPVHCWSRVIFQSTVRPVTVLLHRNKQISRCCTQMDATVPKPWRRKFSNHCKFIRHNNIESASDGPPPSA